MNMKIEITDAHAKLVSCHGKLTTGMVGAQVEFHFNNAWDDLKKIAVFRAGSIVKDLECIDTVVEIPVEVLQEPRQTLEIGVYGYNDTGELFSTLLTAFCGSLSVPLIRASLCKRGVLSMVRSTTTSTPTILPLLNLKHLSLPQN